MTDGTTTCRTLYLGAAFIAALGATPGLAQSEGAEAPASEAEAALTAPIASAEGTQLGTVDLSFAPSGLAVVDIALTGATPGQHAVHFHQTGVCEAPFESAGGHLSGNMDHGVMTETGPHPGDMPNINVPEAGAVEITYFVPNLTADLVEDSDGTAFIVHEVADDYASQPSGAAGGRMGCAVVVPAS